VPQGRRAADMGAAMPDGPAALRPGGPMAAARGGGGGGGTKTTGVTAGRPSRRNLGVSRRIFFVGGVDNVRRPRNIATTNTTASLGNLI